MKLNVMNIIKVYFEGYDEKIVHTYSVLVYIISVYFLHRYISK